MVYLIIKENLLVRVMQSSINGLRSVIWKVEYAILKIWIY